MAISINDLRNASYRFSTTRTKSLNEARASGFKTAFLCHSHKDRDLVKGLVTLFAESGWQIYVDWADESMPETPNRQTAGNIKQRIVDHNLFLFLATANSMASRWCPWEMGYADGKKHIDQILIIPTTDGAKTHGNEYLELYRRVDWGTLNQLRDLAVWRPGETNGIWLRNF
jgi:hypothetical protein